MPSSQNNTSGLDVPGTDAALLLCDRLEAARERIEGTFLSASEGLGRAVEGVAVLIKGLDQLGAGLGPEEFDATIGAMTDSAEALSQLPERRAARRRRLDGLVDLGSLLTGRIDEMGRQLAYLGVFAINIKITAGGIPEAGEEFGLFAQEISDCIALGRSQLERFAADLGDLNASLRLALKLEQAISDDCAALLPPIVNVLTGSSQSVLAHQARVAQIAEEVASLARAIQRKVGGALGGLQIGDITRQRIEHIQLGLRRLIDLSDMEQCGGRIERVRRFMFALLCAQTRATAEDFHREVARIGANLEGILLSAQELLALGKVVAGAEDSTDRGFLDALKTGVGQALELVAEVDAGNQEAQAVGRKAATAVNNLSGQIASVQNIRADVQVMALNTRLKCSRIGEAGRPLAVAAVELRAHAGHLQDAACRTLEALEDLAAAAGELNADGTDVGGVGRVAKSLRGVVARIGEASASTEAELAATAGQSADLIVLLRNAGERISAHQGIGIALNEVADSLENLGQDMDPDPADIADLLAAPMSELAKAYTMAQERTTHAVFARYLNPIEPEAIPLVADGPDLDEVLF